MLDLLGEPEPDQQPLRAMSFPIQFDPRKALPVRLHLYSGPQPESPDQADPSKLLGTLCLSSPPVQIDQYQSKVNQYQHRPPAS